MSQKGLFSVDISRQVNPRCVCAWACDYYLLITAIDGCDWLSVIFLSISESEYFSVQLVEGLLVLTALNVWEGDGRQSGAGCEKAFLPLPPPLRSRGTHPAPLSSRDRARSLRFLNLPHTAKKAAPMTY